MYTEGQAGFTCLLDFQEWCRCAVTVFAEDLPSARASLALGRGYVLMPEAASAWPKITPVAFRQRVL